MMVARRFFKLSTDAIVREIVGNALNSHYYKVKSSAILRRNNAVSQRSKKATTFDQEFSQLK